jgi:hypothetical protein
MANDGAPKSAIELAMERLRKKDEAAGITTRALTDAEKAAIAEVRSLYDSKIAEQQILQESALKRVFDPAEREEIDRQFRREKEHLVFERDAKIEKIRRGAG